MSDRRCCAFILTHGRPDSVLTLDVMHADGYTGDWYVVIDNLDATRDRYLERFGADRVIVFDKPAIAETFDTADLSDDYRSVVFARNACFQLARDRGYTHFVELDDDYNSFRHRYEDAVGLRDGGETPDLDAVFAAMYDFLDESGASAVAFAQRGDLIGGALGSKWKERILRKCMNAIFCRASDEWRFVARVNEDAATYTSLGSRGHLFFSTTELVLNQVETQSRPGGMTELYKLEGTYQKSFYAVMMTPSAVHVGAMGNDRPRLHHHVWWNRCVPKIVPEECRKIAADT